jgi:hypothetical protein
VKLTAALVKEQRVLFAVVLVKSYVLNSVERGQTIQAAQQFFPGYNIILMSQDGRGIPTFFGRRDIVGFLQSVPVNSLPWKEFTFAI